MAKKILDFDIPEHLPWRKQTDDTTSNKLKFIIQKCQNISKPNQQFLEDFRKAMTIEFVYESNKASSVGTQSYEKVMDILMKIMSLSGESEDDSKEEDVTLNTEKALKEMTDKSPNQLSIESIEKLHKILMYSISTTDGDLRCNLDYENEVITTRPDGTTHYYPDHTLVKPMLEGVIQQHNIHMACVPDTIQDKVPFLIKSAAWILTRFVTIHPFTDGNGRVCRILANHVLSQVIPFPVHVYKTGEVDRQHYIDAIIQCQDDNGPPQKMAALLVDSVYNGMKKMEGDHEQWKAHPKYVIVPVQGQNGDVAWEKVHGIFKNATEADHQKVIKLCQTSISEANHYNETILHDDSKNVDYMVRIFRE